MSEYAGRIAARLQFCGISDLDAFEGLKKFILRKFGRQPFCHTTNNTQSDQNNKITFVGFHQQGFSALRYLRSPGC